MVLCSLLSAFRNTSTSFAVDYQPNSVIAAPEIEQEETAVEVGSDSTVKSNTELGNICVTFTSM